MWTGESQLVGESVLAHEGFFLRSFGIDVYEVVNCKHVRWSAHMVLFLFGGVMGKHVYSIPFR